MSSTVIAKNIQIGTSGTATNNFNWYQPAAPDGTVRLGVGNYGATTLDAVTVTNAGNVGIGTSSPGAKLDVVTNSSNNARLLFTSDANGQAGIQAVNAANSGTIALGLNVTGGNVGIGTSSPGEKLSLSNSSGNTKLRTDSGSNQVYMGWDSTDAISEVATNGAWRVRTGSGFTERARIDSSGNFIISGSNTFYTNTASFSNTSGTGKWQNNRIELSAATTVGQDLMYFRNANGIVGAVGTVGSSTYYNTSSDYRLKHDIQPMTGALARVAALKPVKYKWNSDDSNGEGFIAHELQAVVPQCVTGEKDAVDENGDPKYQGIDTSFLVATLTAAIQEQQALIESLTARIAALEAK